MSTSTRVRRAGAAQPPRLRARWAARQILGRRSLLAVVTEIGANRDGIVAVKAGRRNYFIVWKPAYLEGVLVSHQSKYAKSIHYRLLAAVLGDGLVTSERELWARQRRLIQPMFAKRHLGQFAAHMTAAIADFRADWETRGDAEVDVAAAMNKLTLDVVGRALFGTQLGGEAARLGPVITDGVREGGRAARFQLVFPPPRWLADRGPRLLRRIPLPSRRFRKIRNVLLTTDDIVDKIIDARLARGAAGPEATDLLGLLLAARDESGAAMSRRQVRDELMTFMIAGHETTANGLAWMWYLLSRHPEARDRMLAEIDEVLGDRTPTAEDADRLVWTAAVFQEAIRLYPPVWAFVRQAVAEDEIDGRRIPKRSTIIIATYLAQRDPDLWPDPERFDPSRFLPEQSYPRHAYLPFGAGRRICVGAGFAIMEATLITAMIAQRFVLDFVDASSAVPEATITLRPRDGILMTLRPRSSRPPRPAD